MTWLLGAMLALGVLLVASPWLWPTPQRREERSHRALAARLRDRLAHAGLDDLPPLALGLLATIAAMTAAGVALVVVPVPALAVAAALAGAAAPIAAVRWRARTRQSARAAAWPDVVDHLVSAIRAGRALPDALGQLGEAGPSLTREAFRAYAGDYRATGSFSYALDRLKTRLADPTADRILETLRMAREVGGTEVTAVLRQLAGQLRADLATRGELAARQSWVVNAARLGVVAPWIVLLVLATRPEAAAAYTAPGGTALIAGGAAVTIVAYRVMLRIGRLPEEARWFA